jgi:hypothetical protein
MAGHYLDTMCLDPLHKCIPTQENNLEREKDLKQGSIAENSFTLDYWIDFYALPFL